MADTGQLGEVATGVDLTPADPAQRQLAPHAELSHAPLSPDEIAGAPEPVAEAIAAATHNAASALEKLRTPEFARGSDDPSDAILRLLAIVEQIQRAASSRPAGKAISPDIISRIERLETMVANLRTP
jgi:hypothetical protein